MAPPTVTKGVSYRQAECTWIFNSFGSQLQTFVHGIVPTIPVSQTLQLQIGENNGQNTPNWSAQLDLMRNHDSSSQGSQLCGQIKLRPLQSLPAAASGHESGGLKEEFSIVVYVVDANGHLALKTTARKDSQSQTRNATGAQWLLNPISDRHVKKFRFILPGSELGLTHNQQLYFPNDKLRIRAKIACHSGNELARQSQSSKPANATLLDGASSFGSTSRLVKLSADMLAIKNSGLQSDFEIVCNGITYPVHQTIIAARSPVFATMLATDMKERNEKKLTDNDCTPETLKVLLHYIYSSNIEIEKHSPELVFGLTMAADKYQLEELKDICFTHMVKSLSLETAGNVAVTAYLYSAPRTVRETVFQFCAKNWQTLASSNEFQAINAAWPKAFHKP